MSVQAVIEAARADLGYTENPPGSNKVKYWEAYNKEYQGSPWCVAALWYWFDQAGERMAFFGGGKTASCSILLRWYKEQGLTVPVSEVRAGDIVLLNFHGKSEPEHCGLVATVGKRNGDTCVWTIEGNTSVNGSQDNGGMVAEKTRYPSQIVGVCRPQYKPEEPEAKDDITGHWAEKSIRKAVRKGTMSGYPDGSFRPNDPVTRAELATILDRLGLLG